MFSFLPRDVLDEIWDLIESVSEGFPPYSWLYAEKAHPESPFSFFDADVPRSTAYGVYMSHLISFGRVSSHVTDFIQFT